MDTQMGVRPAGKRQTGVCRSPEVITKGDLPRGMKRSGINPSAATKIQTGFIPVLIFGIVVDDKDPRGRQKSRFCKCNAAKPLRFGKGPAHKVCGNTQSTALLSYFATLWLRRTGQNFPVFRDFLFRKKFPISSEFVSFSRYIYIF